MALKRALIAGASLMVAASAANAEDAIKTTTGAPAPDPRDERIAALEQALKDIQAQLAEMKSTSADVAEIRRVQKEAPKVDLKNGRPTFASADGKFKVAIRGMFQADAASYLQVDATPDYRGAGSGSIADNLSARDLSSGMNFRRARIGLEGTVLKDWNWAVTYDMGGSGTEGANLQQAWVEYAGFKPWGLPLRIRGGAYAWTAGLEDATSNTESLFLERAAPAELVRGFAGADGRNGVGVFVNGERWNASAAFTGALVGNTGEYDEQTGYVMRVDGLVLKAEDYNLHAGVNASGILNPPDTAAPGVSAAATVRLRERPELRVDATRLVDTGNLSAKNLTALGYELGANYKNLLLTGEYFDISVDRAGTTPDADFSGWYTQGSWVLTGERHAWNASAGGYSGVKVDKPFNLATGDMGAWEIAARYSTLDLNFREGVAGLATPAGGVRGGEQEITTLGLNFYPNNVIRFLLDYQWVSIDRLNPTTLAASGVPVGGQIGQDYDAVSLRTQLAF